MKYLISSIAFVSIGISAIPGELFSAGNDAMIDEKYEDAVQAYESIIALGVEHPDVYYNLGNAYFRLHYLGHSIWAYSNSLKYAPRDVDAQHNLSVAKARRIDRIDMPESLIFLQIYRKVKSNFTLREWLLLGSLILLFQSLWLFGLQFGWLRGHLSKSILTGIIILTIGIHGLTADKYFQEMQINRGVVISNGIDAYSGPFYGENTVLFRINEGSIADIQKTQKNWMEIILIDGKKGWIPTQSIRTLK